MNSILHSSIFLKKILALFLSALFTLAITPKKTLHNILANHTDNSPKKNNSKDKQLNIAGYNCKCDDLVAESSFIANTDFIINISASFHAIFSLHYISFISLSHLFFNLRGPPVMLN